MTLRYITDDKGKKKAVVLPIQEYEELLEDLRDLAVVAERRDEPSVSHQEALARAFDSRRQTPLVTHVSSRTYSESKNR